MSSGGERYDIFISYHRLDEPEARQLYDQLAARNLNVFFDRVSLPPGQRWSPRIEQALTHCRCVVVVYGRNGLGPTQAEEVDLALQRQRRDKSLAVIPLILEQADPPTGFLNLRTWLEWHQLDKVDTIVAVTGGRALDAAQQAAADKLRDQVCPYRELRIFREEDASYFFGRTHQSDQLAQLVEAAAAHPLVAVVGASGRGKSSLVQAGLIPRLRRSTQRKWTIAVLRPGDRPLRALSAAIFTLLDEPNLSDNQREIAIDDLAQRVYEGSSRLRDRVAALMKSRAEEDRLLLVVDQWEELYAGDVDPAMRERFSAELLDMLEREPVSVILTVRDDAYPRLLDSRALVDRLDRAIVNLGPINADEIHKVIVGPAEEAGYSFDPQLLHELRDELVRSPDSLPLLELCLTDLWRCRNPQRCVIEKPQQFAGIEKAIGTRAERWFERLRPADKAAARALLVGRLATIDREGRMSKRRIDRGELEPALIGVAESLVRERLAVVGRDDVNKTESIELVHEAVIHGWDQLRRWLQGDQKFQIWQQELDRAQQVWTAAATKRAHLLDGDDLHEAWRRYRANRERLTKEQRQFIESSHRAHRQRRRRNVSLLILVVALLSLWPLHRWYHESIRPEIERQVTACWSRDIAQPDHELVTPVLCAREIAAERLGYGADIAREKLWPLWRSSEEPWRTWTQLPDPQKLDLPKFQRAADMLIESLDPTSDEGIKTAGAIGWTLDYLAHYRSEAADEHDRLRQRLTQRLRRGTADGSIAPLLAGWKEIPLTGFEMGSPETELGHEDDEPKHQVELSGKLLVLPHEVTNREWNRFRPNPRFDTNEEQLPVVAITWFEVYAYAVWLGNGARLPTEAEWEFLARGKTQTRFWSGDEESDLARVAWYDVNSLDRLQNVCSREGGTTSHPYGLCDVVGNAWEWTADWYEERPAGPTSPWGPPRGFGRVIRGGSFQSEARFGRAANRDDWNPRFGSEKVGFRVVRPAPRASGR